MDILGDQVDLPKICQSCFTMGANSHLNIMAWVPLVFLGAFLILGSTFLETLVDHPCQNHLPMIP